MFKAGIIRVQVQQTVQVIQNQGLLQIQRVQVVQTIRRPEQLRTVQVLIGQVQLM